MSSTLHLYVSGFASAELEGRSVLAKLKLSDGKKIDDTCSTGYEHFATTSKDAQQGALAVRRIFRLRIRTMKTIVCYLTHGSNAHNGHMVIASTLV